MHCVMNMHSDISYWAELWNWILASMSVYKPRHLHIQHFLFNINTSLEISLCVEDSIEVPWTTGSYGPVQTPVNQSIFFISLLGMFWHLVYFHNDLNCSRRKVQHFFILVSVVGKNSWLGMDGLLLLFLADVNYSEFVVIFGAIVVFLSQNL